MAHECPDCGATCYCGGDIDDCCLNIEDDVRACQHYRKLDCAGHEEYCNDLKCPCQEAPDGQE